MVTTQINMSMDRQSVPQNRTFAQPFFMLSRLNEKVVFSASVITPGSFMMDHTRKTMAATLMMGGPIFTMGYLPHATFNATMAAIAATIPMIIHIVPPPSENPPPLANFASSRTVSPTPWFTPSVFNPSSKKPSLIDLTVSLKDDPSNSLVMAFPCTTSVTNCRPMRDPSMMAARMIAWAMRFT